MILVLALAAVLWGVGHLMGAPRSARISMIGLLYIGVLALHLLLPDAHPLRMATGESAALWLIVGGFVVLVWGYRRVLAGLRARAGEGEAKRAAAGPAPAFSDTELNRYARHIVLREIGGPGQKALKEAKVLVIGAGGLGAPALQYLAAAGLGTIGVVDDDSVENANLQRQVIHKDSAIGTPKVFSAQAEMEAQNPYVTVRPYHRRLTADIAAGLFAEYDLVLDGTDNFETRYLVNETAVAAGIPLVSGALSQWEGQISVFDPSAGAPCYRCVFDAPPPPELAPSCAEAGVIGPLPGVIGAMMAVEAIKIITGAGAVLRGQMVIYDALYGESRRITVRRRDDCPVCAEV
ncbi:HesA/MoeB/ThiF family protein [Roseobacter ponti]|uniref:Molybdopterin-synthase adenylyltransferase n=1 Tax=Roseobacter ponti TaxID=1891787 RepID=A0A858SQC1_9RHOB|nr:molybdopterin-synthase adenylyltransferase MoeB [Roseobacter ponti]QJF50048.1 molybdopterin-synthase adenylyltransferase MoeB [Roseobacter ponti]